MGAPGGPEKGTRAKGKPKGNESVDDAMCQVGPEGEGRVVGVAERSPHASWCLFIHFSVGAQAKR